MIEVCMAELRFAFGKNWDDFVSQKLSDKIVQDSMEHMRRFMKRDSLEGKTFLDIGCGSGIHSLAALRLGAKSVVSFDYDDDSVLTTRKVRDWSGETRDWKIMQGSVLDDGWMRSLPKSDIVYSWGVLHHTGSMWNAVRNAAIPLKEDGEFYIALYSSDIYLDPTPEFWIRLKRAYNRADPLTRKLLEMKHLYWSAIKPEIAAGRDPLGRFGTYGKRGMTTVIDAKDWLGGYPMEFAGLAETRAFCARELSLDLVNVLTGEGCTEYLFARRALNAHWRAIEERRSLVPLAGPFRPESGAAYVVDLPPALSAEADEPGHDMRSTLMVYEDGAPLGLAHCVHDDIRKHGKGRFSHWKGQLVFSASDNSDPNSNGRKYAYCVRY